MSEVRLGIAPELLVEESASVALIVVGSHGLGGLRGVLVGSVALKVAAQASCPVIVVRGPATPPEGPIVVGVDDSAESERAVEFAMEFACVREVRDHGAFAYSVDLGTGAVRALAGGVGLKYYSPGCGLGDTAVFTITLDQQTRLLSANLATGKIDADTTTPGQITSAVPAASEIVGVAGNRLISLPAKGNPTVLATLPGDVYDVRPAADGSVSFLHAKPGSRIATVAHDHAGKVSGSFAVRSRRCVSRWGRPRSRSLVCTVSWSTACERAIRIRATHRNTRLWARLQEPQAT